MHQSDLVRLHILNRMGGVYLDSDAFVLRDLRRWRRCDFAIGAERDHAKLNNGLMLARNKSAFGRHWWDHLRAWDGTGWDEHSCVWPWLACERSPQLLAASAELGPILPPRTFPDCEGAHLACNASALVRALANRDAIHLVAFRAWVKDAPDALWRIVNHVLDRAAKVRAARNGEGLREST